MIYFFVCYVLACFYKCKFAGLNNFNEAYISRESTTAVNGIFTGLIVFGHYVQYFTDYTSADMYYMQVRSFFGQMVVSLFLVYSGYGIYESYKRKGESYIKLFPRNRILKLILHLDFAVIFFAVLFLILRKEFTLLKFLLSLTGWEFIGNNNWFIFATFIFYLITFISFRLFENKKVLPLVSVTLMVVVYIVIIQKFKPTFWYNSAICFPVGMWYSYFKVKIEKFVMKNSIVHLLFLILTVSLFIGIRFYWGGFAETVTYLLSCMFFAFSFILLTMKLQFGNAFLLMLGKHSFSIYMLQRVPMIILHHMGILTEYPHISFVISFAVMLVLSCVFDRFTDFIDLKIFNKETVCV